MKRWDNIACDWSEENPEGRWVLFADHAAEVHRLNNELTRLTLELAALKREKPEVQR